MGIRRRPSTSTAILNAFSFRASLRAPASPPSSGHDATAYTQNAGSSAAAIGAGNAYMKEVAKNVPTKRGSTQRLEQVVASICSKNTGDTTHVGRC